MQTRATAAFVILAYHKCIVHVLQQLCIPHIIHIMLIGLFTELHVILPMACLRPLMKSERKFAHFFTP